MTEFTCRRTGRTYRAGEELDRDGDAAVHVVEPASSELALKRYLPAALQERSDLEARVQAMIAGPPAYRTGPAGHPSCAWPEDTAYVAGRFAGFVMPRMDTASARTVHDVATARDTSWGHRVAVAANLARAVALLHDADVVVGDLPERDLLTWSDGRVTLLGCDRMQVVDPESKRRFPCRAEPDGGRAPELLHASLGSTLRTSSSDIFALAVRLHTLLLPGQHPFQGQWRGSGPQPAEHVLAGDGLWAYAGDPRFGPHPDAAPLDVLPEAVRQYFRAAFVDGARRPQDRPPARRWADELDRLRDSLVPCPRDPGHVHGRHLPDCPWCPPDARPPRSGGPAPAGRPAPPRPARAPVPAATAPPGSAPTLRTDPGDTVMGSGPAPLTVRMAPTPPAPSTERPPARSRRRSPLHALAWVVLAIGIGVGGVLGVAGATNRSEPAAIGPAGAASTRAASAPSSARPAPGPGDELDRVRAGDAATVETLADSWVAQLSARPAGTADATVLAGHDAARSRYPGAVLLRSTDWNYAGDFWITVMGRRFATAEEANAWCDTQRIAPRECFAKKLSKSGTVEGSERYRG